MSTFENQTGRLPRQSMLQQRYLIIGPAGRGGMSAVYQAVDTQSGSRHVAIKEMSQGHLDSPEVAEAVARFRQEASLLGSLHHSNLPRIYDAFGERGRSFLVMDFIEGKNLLQLLQENSMRPLSVAQVVGYALQLCDVLAYLHQHQPPIIFRDLKPTNVMVTESGHIYLIDFGIARFFKEGQLQDTVLLGSPGYAPPEQHGSAQTSPRSDLYALGATLHCCLTGKDPYLSNDHFVFSPVRQYNPLVPFELDQLIQRMVAVDERQSRQAAVVSLSSILLPLVMGASLAFFLYPQFAGPHANLASFMLLVGTAMAITAFPVLARLLMEKNMLGTKVGTLALTSAAVGDVIAWCLLALLISVIQAKGLASITLTVGILVLFIVVMFTVIRPLLLIADRRIKSKPVLLALTMILLLLSAYITNAIGIHPVFGAFLMGVILPRRTVFIDQVRSIDQTNSLLFLPLYFVYSGLRTHIGLINSPVLWLICGLVLLVACSGKIFGATFSARLLGDSWKESLTLGTLMNTRGLVELIVLNIGLDLGVLSPTLFAMLVIMALVTTMMASPLLPLFGYRQKKSQESRLSDQSEGNMQGPSLQANSCES